ncbi:MAG: serine/threonine-protein kinase [Sulfuricaulis sp.]
MSAKTNKADKLQSTVIISDRFAERRSPASARSASENSAEPLEPGSLVGRYLTLSRVGIGGMGVVYRAHDTELNRTVALKVLPPHLCKHPEYLRRFRTEARAQARLNSPYVITLYELMEHPVGEILVLEYVEGETLEKRLRHNGPMSVSEAVRTFVQTLRGVEQIHQAGVVHRDLKPSNIFITRDGQIKLMDFGIARILDNQDPSLKGTMVGTLLYISPEQINGRDTDCRSDIYTLGISLFEVVTGRLPFERRSDYALMHAHVQENPPSPKEYQRRVPRELESVILKAIAKDPDRRYQSAAEFRDALLGLRLIERRQSSASDPGNIALLAHGSETSAQRIWGGALVDLALVGMALMLMVFLDLYPMPKKSLESIAVKSTPVQKIKNQMPARASSRTPEPALATKKIETRPEAVKNRRDKYESLRDAWGS